MAGAVVEMGGEQALGHAGVGTEELDHDQFQLVPAERHRLALC
jgi:hypothetical protein